MGCQDGACISLDKYCDGFIDCAGKEDEPRDCTRMYYDISQYPSNDIYFRNHEGIAPIPNKDKTK